MRPIHQARELADRFGLDPILPPSFGKKEVEDIEFLYWLVFDRTPRKGAGMLIKTRIDHKGALALIRSRKRGDDAGLLKLDGVNTPFTFLGCEVVPGHVVFSLTKAELVTEPAEIRRKLARGKVDGCDVEWRGSDTSEFLVDVPEAK